MYECVCVYVRMSVCASECEYVSACERKKRVLALLNKMLTNTRYNNCLIMYVVWQGEYTIKKHEKYVQDIKSRAATTMPALKYVWMQSKNMHNVQKPGFKQTVQNTRTYAQHTHTHSHIYTHTHTYDNVHQHTSKALAGTNPTLHCFVGTSSSAENWCDHAEIAILRCSRLTEKQEEEEEEGERKTKN